ncbi:uncharacterized protein LOC111133095 isoform X1 [Crassostrea virginica]
MIEDRMQSYDLCLMHTFLVSKVTMWIFLVINYLMISSIIPNQRVVGNSTPCRRYDYGCCFNEYNVNGNCRECPLGTLGVNCSSECPEGYYGKLCKEECDCTLNHYCDHRFGCQECPPGTFGLNCSGTCPNKYYGRFCLEECKCKSNEYCDIQKGCLQCDCTICDPTYGCLQKNKDSPYSPTSLSPAKNNVSSRDSTNSISTKSTEYIWKSTAIVLTGALIVVLIYIGRKKCSSWVLKRKWGNAAVPSVLFRVQNTVCSIDESLVNHRGDSNHGSGDRNFTSLQKRHSSPNFFLKSREDDTNFADVVEQTYGKVWGENGLVLTKPLNSNLSKTEDEQANKLNNGLSILSEDKCRQYSSLRHNRYSHRKENRNRQTVEKESRESEQPNNDYDDATSCFKANPTNRNNYLDVELSSCYLQNENKAIHHDIITEERASSRYQEVDFGPTYSNESPDPSYNNQVQVPDYETERCSSNHTGSKEDTESASNNSLYTSLIVGESSEYVFSSNEKENYNQYEL